MKGLWNGGWKAAMVLLAASGWAAADTSSMPAPGTVNYIEGNVNLNGQTTTSKSVGEAVVEPGQTLNVIQGKAEILLTPGVFLRVGDNSEVRMIQAGLADTTVEVVKGEAMVEVTQLFKESRLNVLDHGVTMTIEKAGLYAFNADSPRVGVVEGKAELSGAGKNETLNKGHEAVLADGQSLKSRDLEKGALENDPLYRWSAVRSEYESQANVDEARNVMDSGMWDGPGWYMDPFWDFYAFLPGDGMMYSPFGYGFYSPGYVWAAPVGRYPYVGTNGRGVLGSQGFRRGSTFARNGSTFARNGAVGHTGGRFAAPRMSGGFGGGMRAGGGGFGGGMRMGGGGFGGGMRGGGGGRGR